MIFGNTKHRHGQVAERRITLETGSRQLRIISCIPTSDIYKDTLYTQVLQQWKEIRRF